MSFRNQNEDLFQESRMSFGEHLEELRKVLIRSLIGIAVGCVFGFVFAEQVVNVLQRPLENALTSFHVKQGKKQLRAEHGYVAPELNVLLDEQQKVPETVLIEPGQLVAGLRKISPDFLAGVTLKPYRFSLRQFDEGEIQTLCRKWPRFESAQEQQIVQLKFLWSLISPDQQQRIKEIGNSPQINSKDQQWVVDVLNDLLSKDEINRATEFESLINRTKQSLNDVLQSDKPNPLLEMKQQLDLKFDPDLCQRLNRLLISSSFSEYINDVQPEMIPLTIWKSARYRSQSLGATETFMIWVKAGVITGLLIASPWVFYQLWTFVAAGLYPTEQRHVYFFMPASILLFFSGALLAFLFVFEPVLEFLFSFNERMGIIPQPRINDWLSFVLFLPLGFGVAFQLPLVMLFANRIELISIEAFTSKWRIAVVAIFGISMLLTPADPVSMVMLAIPLTALYFLGILLCRWLNKPSNAFPDAAVE